MMHRGGPDPRPWRRMAVVGALVAATAFASWLTTSAAVAAPPFQTYPTPPPPTAPPATAVPPTSVPAPSTGGGGGDENGEPQPSATPTRTPTRTPTPTVTATKAPPTATSVPPSPTPAQVQVTRPIVAGAASVTESFAVSGGQAITLTGQITAPGATTLTITFDPRPPEAPLLPFLADRFVHPQRVAPPVDIQIKTDQPIADGDVTITFPYTYLGVDFAALGDRRFSVFQGVYEDGALIGLAPTQGTHTQDFYGWAITVPAASLEFTPFIPVVVTPAWVQNHDPLVHTWSGPTREARDFGFAGPQFTTFTVVAPQVAERLFVFSPVVQNYAWIDTAGVGPSGPPLDDAAA